MCLMAVVIQDQVKSQIAGVAFTRDPNTGDPEKITIAACVGLGEVSYSQYCIRYNLMVELV